MLFWYFEKNDAIILNNDMRTKFNQYTGLKYSKEDLITLAKMMKSRSEFHDKGFYTCSKKIGCEKECLEIIDTNVNLLKITEVLKIKEQIKLEALKCFSKTQFRELHPKLYYMDNINKWGIINNIIPAQKFSTHQYICKYILEALLKTTAIYNDRTILSGKELDIFFPSFNIACEYNSFYWHINKQINDSYKQKHCKEKNIYLIEIIEPTKNEYIDLDNAINKIKKQLELHLENISNIVGFIITPDDLYNIIVDKTSIFYNTFNMKDIDYIVNNCNRYSEIKTKYNKIWQYLSRHKLLSILDPVKKRDYIYMNKDEMVEYIKNTFPLYTNFVKHKIYQLVRKRGYLDDVKSLYSIP